jgi:hypothetical protein
MKRFKRVLLIASICVFFPLVAYGAELSKSDASKILTIMGYNKLQLFAVINGIGIMGMGAFSSPNTATVIGYADQQGKARGFQLTYA